MGFERGSLKVNINPFIPKLNTPYANYVDNYLAENLDVLTMKFEKLTRELKKVKAVKLKTQHPKQLITEAKLQTIFSLGDNTLSKLLIEYYHNGAKYSNFKNAEKSLGFSSNYYLNKIKNGYNPWII